MCYSELHKHLASPTMIEASERGYANVLCIDTSGIDSELNNPQQNHNFLYDKIRTPEI